MSLQFIYGVPNVTAWCNATVSFLQGLGEAVPSPVSARSIQQDAKLMGGILVLTTGGVTSAGQVCSPALSDYEVPGEKPGLELDPFYYSFAWPLGSPFCC
jgi:hypothetical protein